MKELVKKLIRWSLNTKILSLPRRIFGGIVIYAIQSKGAIVVGKGTRVISYSNPERNLAIALINKIWQDTEMRLSSYEEYLLFMVVKKTEKIEGDIAEVGVYKGGIAKVICEAKGDRPLHLFDTFEGIPKVDEINQGFYEGQFAAPIEDAENYLKEYKKVYFYKGIFPTTAGPIKNNKFSFVHLDVDTYESTLNCLEFFYPRMNRGGIIISHDYPFAAGVTKAVDEFFEDKTEPIIEMLGARCLIVKL